MGAYTSKRIRTRTPKRALLRLKLVSAALVLTCLFLIARRPTLVEPVNDVSSPVTSSSEIPHQTSRGVDVLDIGSNLGGSVSFMENALNQVLRDSHKRSIVVKVLGVDKDPKKVSSATANGAHVVEADVLQTSIVDLEKLCQGRVMGVTVWHVLEHMPDCAVASAIWRKASKLVREFISFRGPSFDDFARLRDLGFHRYYEDWHGHTCEYTSRLLLESLYATSRPIEAAIVILSKPITSSDSRVILPRGSVSDSHHYDPARHPSKVSLPFEVPFYEEMRACIVYRTNEISLRSAMCLRDVLRHAKNDAKIVHCMYHAAQGGECVSSLRRIVGEIVEKVNSMPILAFKTSWES